MTTEEVRRRVRQYNGGVIEQAGGLVLFTCSVRLTTSGKETVDVNIGTWDPHHVAFVFPGEIVVHCPTLDHAAYLAIGFMMCNPRPPAIDKKMKALPAAKRIDGRSGRGRRIIKSSDPFK